MPNLAVWFLVRKANSFSWSVCVRVCLCDADPHLNCALKKKTKMARYAAVTHAGEVVVTKPELASTLSLGPSVTDVESLCSSFSTEETEDYSERFMSIMAHYSLPVAAVAAAGEEDSSSSSFTKSILKFRTSDPSLVKNTNKAWKSLPKPDLDTIILLSEKELQVQQDQEQQDQGQRVQQTSNVRWGLVQIRSYSQTVGDNPSVSYGPPIQLDWAYEQHEDVNLDEYEGSRVAKRTLRQMVLSYYYRKNLLSWQYGVTEAELKKAKKQAERAKLKREITRSFLPAMRAEAAVESAGRKAKRLFSKKNNINNNNNNQ